MIPHAESSGCVLRLSLSSDEMFTGGVTGGCEWEDSLAPSDWEEGGVGG